MLTAASPPGSAVSTLFVPTAESLKKLHVLLGDVTDPHARHRAFMILRRLGGLPPTLFRVMEEDEPSAGGGLCSPSFVFAEASHLLQ